jgi:beta-galactosidase
VVWSEIPLIDRITDSSAFRANARQQLRELIRQNYNHPSIVFWGIGNEQRTNDSATNSLLATLANDVAAEDPDRFSAYAHISALTNALTGHTDMIGYNRYYGWYSGSYNEFGAFVDSVHGAQPLRLFSISEYGAGASILQHQENPPKPVLDSDFHPEEYQSLLHEATWAQIQARPWLWGTFVWSMFDFAADHRSEGDTYGRNDKGMVTYDRSVRKDAFYWYKANWTATPFVYITSRRYNYRAAASTTVKVYGTTDIAILRLNGVQVGAPQRSADRIFKWPVRLIPGANRIEVIGSRDGATYTNAVTWTLR